MPCSSCCLWPLWITLWTPHAQHSYHKLPWTFSPHTQGSINSTVFPQDFISNHFLGHVEVLTCTAPVSCARLSILPQLLSSTTAIHYDALGQLLISLQPFYISIMGNNIYFPKKPIFPPPGLFYHLLKLLTLLYL